MPTKRNKAKKPQKTPNKGKNKKIIPKTPSKDAPKVIKLKTTPGNKTTISNLMKKRNKLGSNQNKNNTNNEDNIDNQKITSSHKTRSQVRHEKDKILFERYFENNQAYMLHVKLSI